jgi:hypothetical protein
MARVSTFVFETYRSYQIASGIPVNWKSAAGHTGSPGFETIVAGWAWQGQCGLDPRAGVRRMLAAVAPARGFD